MVKDFYPTTVDGTFELQDGYTPVRKTIPRPVVRVRRMTLDEIKSLSGHAEFIANDGTLRRLKINGRVRTWKRDTERVEVPVKYGMYEYGTMDTAEARYLWARHTPPKGV